jgi:hypothetical protein
MGEIKRDKKNRKMTTIKEEKYKNIRNEKKEKTAKQQEKNILIHRSGVYYVMF